MEQILINLVAGALGGVGAGKASPNFDLGMLGNVIAGLVGGGVLGQIVKLLLPAVTADRGRPVVHRLIASLGNNGINARVGIAAYPLDGVTAAQLSARAREMVATTPRLIATRISTSA